MQHDTVGFVSCQLLTRNFSEALSELFRPCFPAGMDGTGQGKSHYCCSYNVPFVSGKSRVVKECCTLEPLVGSRVEEQGTGWKHPI